MVTTCWSQVWTCLGSRDEKSPRKMAVPMEPHCLEFWIASATNSSNWQAFVCPSKIPTKLVELIMSLWAEQTGVLKPGMVVAFAPVNSTSEVKSVERYRTATWHYPWGHYRLLCQECACQRCPSWQCYWWQSKWPIRGNSWLHHSSDYPEPSRSSQCWPCSSTAVECPTAHIPCKSAGLKEKTDCSSGKKLYDGPKFLKSGDTIIMDMPPGKSVCVESSSGRPLFAVHEVRLLVLWVSPRRGQEGFWSQQSHQVCTESMETI
jgi:elongation factor 1-alpha